MARCIRGEALWRILDYIRHRSGVAEPSDTIGFGLAIISTRVQRLWSDLGGTPHKPPSPVLLVSRVLSFVFSPRLLAIDQIAELTFTTAKRHRECAWDVKHVFAQSYSVTKPCRSGLVDSTRPNGNNQLWRFVPPVEHCDTLALRVGTGCSYKAALSTSNATQILYADNVALAGGLCNLSSPKPSRTMLTLGIGNDKHVCGAHGSNRDIGSRPQSLIQRCGGKPKPGEHPPPAPPPPKPVKPRPLPGVD